MRLLLLLPLLAACPAGDPCTWSVSNGTGEPVVSLFAASSRGGSWQDDIVATAPLVSGDTVVFDVDPGRYDLRADGHSGDRYIVFDAARCQDGEVLETTLSPADREIY